jgi:hypothetical protein
MRTKPFATRAAPAFSLLFALFLGACSPLDSGSEMLNAATVKFSEGSPAVDGQTITYSGSPLSPSLDKFRFKMTFHVKADNSKNSGKAVFGTDALKPILNFRINSKSATPISTPIPAFSIEGGAIADLEFPIEVPFTVIDKAMARKIVDGDPIPYFLSGTLQFDLLEGTALKGKGASELDLASGEISTRPSGSVTSLLSGLL